MLYKHGLGRLRIPDSPIERQPFSVRSLRKVLGLACCMSLAWIALHKTLHSDIAKSVPHKYSFFYISDDATIRTEIEQDHTGESDAEHKNHAVYKDELPAVIRIPLEEAVEDVDLEGWEDEWFSNVKYDTGRHGSWTEDPKLDMVYTWVNGTDEKFKRIRHEYEIHSPLNDAKGKWISEHGINRYRDWDELRYSFRSLDMFAKNFTNKIQVLVNAIPDDNSTSLNQSHPQRPKWLKNDRETNKKIQVLSHDQFFGEQVQQCLPTFDSLSIEAQIFNTPSDVDNLLALSDDMFLTLPSSASDFYSPLFGPAMGFKPDHYNVKDLGSKNSLPTFGEKAFTHYTSYLLNHRFGERNRHVQAHFAHSISRRVMKEAMASFPHPAMEGACERFRGEIGFQIYPWYAGFHYTIERFREALLWGFVMSRSDKNSDGYLDWDERQTILQSIQKGWQTFSHANPSAPAPVSPTRDRIFYKLPAILSRAGITPPQVNVDVLWTSLDGPETIRKVKCHDFKVDKCFAESFSSPLSDMSYQSPDFTAANIFSQLAKRDTKCGDCVIKFLLENQARGLEPLLPPKSKSKERQVVIKALKKYQSTVVEPDAKFIMIKDSEQAEQELLRHMPGVGDAVAAAAAAAGSKKDSSASTASSSKPSDLTKKGDSGLYPVPRYDGKHRMVGQLCINDDVMTEDQEEVEKVRSVMKRVFVSLFPSKSKWEK